MTKNDGWVCVAVTESKPGFSKSWIYSTSTMRILIVISLLGLMLFHPAPSALVASDNSTKAEPEYEEEGIQVEDAVIAGAVLWAMYALFFSLEIDEYLFGDVNTEQFPKNKDRFEFTLINEKEVGVSFERKF